MFKVAIVQMPNQTDMDRSFAHIQGALERARAHEAALVLFPECALSGFSAHMRERTLAQLEPYLTQLQTWTLQTGIDVVLPTGVADGERVYNSGFVLSQGSRQQLFKLGLTPSEQRFFSAPAASPKVFETLGLRYAVLLCMEAQQPPWTYFKRGEVDLVLWPGYWGWTLEDTWSPLKSDGAPDLVFEHQRAWQVPLLQANFSRNALDDARSSGPQGLSVVVDADGELVGRGAHGEDGVWVVTLELTAQGARVRQLERA